MLQKLACAAALLIAAVAGHGVMYEPPTRNAGGSFFPGHGCPGGSCLWFNQGCSIGCPKATGKGTVYPAKADCANPASPTIAFADEAHRTLNFGKLMGDWTKWHPWRYPGSAPVEDPCGLAGGWYTQGTPGNGGDAPPGAKQGQHGSKLSKLLNHSTVWIAGETAEVAWGVYANHGGGYQFRLCPAERELTEGCFQAHALPFEGKTQWLQFGDGMDSSNRKEIPAVEVSNGTVPKGSTWRRNPIPACKGGTDAISLGAFNSPCKEPQFTPPVPGAFGFGGGSCGSGKAQCTPKQFKDHSFDFGVVDKLRVPATLPAGDYVLSFRWDSEQTPQVWNSCADVTIKRTGQPTKPFRPYVGCEPCCSNTVQGQGLCGNCTKCVHDKTGNCAYCWNPLPGYYGGSTSPTPNMTCLGHDDPKTGGPTKWSPGDPMIAATSPGCTRCWAMEDGCKAQN